MHRILLTPQGKRFTQVDARRLAEKSRLCLTCGHVGCCDASFGRHAVKHFEATGHPLMRSFEPGEHWGWCYVDAIEIDPAPPPPPRSGVPAWR